LSLLPAVQRRGRVLGFRHQWRLHRPPRFYRRAALAAGILSARARPGYAARYNCGSTASSASTAAAPSRLLRSPFQPTSASGRSALSLNGISRVSERQPKASPTCLDASVGLTLVSLSSG